MTLQRGRFAIRYVATIPLVLLAGCALNRQADTEMSAALARYEQRAKPDADAYSESLKPTTRPAAATSQPASQAGSSTTEPQTLREFIVTALAQNPEIKAAEQTARARFARVPQVTALPDPILSTKTLPEPIRTAEGDNFFILGVKQKLLVPEKLDRAGRVALQEARMALEALQSARLRVIADVKRAYFSLYVIDKTLEIDAANQELLRGLIDAARAQVATGRRSQDDVLRAQVELYTLESDLIDLRQRRTTVAAALNRILNRPPATPVPEPGRFELRSVQARLEEMIKLAVDKNPKLERITQQIQRDRESLRLAELAYWPDFTLGFEWIQMDPRGAFKPPRNPQTGIRPLTPQTSEDGSDNWSITFGMNLPIWFEKIRGGIRAARSRLLASQHEYASERNRVYFQVEDALARVYSQRELAELFDGTIIPQARQAYEVSRSAYTSGRSDFLFVIDNWQKWLTFTIQYHRALGELERSVADLEEALGMSLSEAGG